MTSEEKQLIKVKIVKKLQRVKDDIEYLVDATKPISPENSIGRVSRMDAINNKSVSEASLRTARETLNKLEMAMESINSADFGNCKRCGEAIPFKRLMMMPESDRCIKCAGKA